MSAADLLALAERCEREEPSRELDAAIFALCPPKDVEGRWQVSRHDKALVTRDIGTEFDLRPVEPGVRYTSSIDAAVTLVPDHVETAQILREKSGAGTVLLWLSKVREDARIVEGGAKTPALALCAASLRARAEAGKP